MFAVTSSVNIIWALSTVLQLALFFLLFLKGNFRRLPLLTTYVAANLCQAAFLLYLQHRAPATYTWRLTLLAWGSEGVTLILQGFAATEAIHLILKPYPGIWGLAWRTLSFISALMLAFIVKQASTNFGWVLLEADRGYHLLFATALVACFLLIRYYAIRIPSAYKTLLAGFCFFSCASILVNTLLQSILFRNYPDYGQIWQFASILSFASVQCVWIIALRHPLPADNRRISSLPSDEIYQQLAPEIDQRLQLLNDKLARLWKWEPRPQ